MPAGTATPMHSQRPAVLLYRVTLDSAVDTRRRADLTSAASISKTLNDNRGLWPTISRKVEIEMACRSEFLVTAAVMV